MDPELEALGLQLGSVAARNAAGKVSGAITSARAKRKTEETIAELEGIIDDLQADRSELIQIGRAFEEEMVAQRISAEDIEFITETLVPLLKENLGDDDEKLHQLTSILSPELVKVLQVLGFNYRRAIGEPLTELIAGLIRAQKAPAEATATERLKYENLFLQIALDPEATERFERLTGRTLPPPPPK